MSVAWPTRWHNPFRPTVRSEQANAEAIDRFRCVTVPARLAADPDWLNPLRGKHLACWCPSELPCHADVLLTLANAPRP